MILNVNYEMWETVRDFKGRYEVSNFGRVKTLEHKTKGGSAIRQLMTDKDGYKVLGLGKNNQIFKVHRLVLEAFVGPCPNGMEACHNDSNPSNNELSNLRWDTTIGNCKDRRSYNGINNPNSKLTIQQIKEIVERRCKGEKVVNIAKDYGITHQHVSYINKKSQVLENARGRPQ